ncbi:hypothetical protein [Hydromonas duriensis]|uniref:Uncharacterized protein n=1 Tax=Hydromonas duriensis TaxID=1527608 RepID=A0A4V3DJP7_9BURK|nr:hypothetical protein [Hydromonas duriensis]TDR30995.1 hypothetical protein DFR44_11432 [Hydromonas duriensis]
MTTSKHKSNSTTLPHGRQAGGLILNIGIGIVLGLLAALLAVFLVNKGGPFRDHANTNTLTPAAGQTNDPNAPLYGAPPPVLPPSDAKTADTSNSDKNALTGDDAATAEAKKQSATKDTAKSVETPPTDPVAAIISSTDKKAASAKPKTDATNKASTPTKSTDTKPASENKADDGGVPKEVKPASLPKAVSPATAP